MSLGSHGSNFEEKSHCNLIASSMEMNGEILIYSSVLLFQFLTRLSFSEFEELLKIGSREKLSVIDPRLRPIENMNIQWYQRLARVLVTGYNDHHRLFSGSDGLVQYVVCNTLFQVDTTI